MDISLAIISLSLILQLSSAFLAGRLVLLTGHRIAGIIIVTAVSLMGFRRGITFYRLISGKAIKLDFFAEIIALIMSFFGLVGVLYVTRLILTIRRLNEERKKAEEEQRKSSTEIQDLYDNAPCGYHSLDKDGVFVRVNNTELSWLGYSRKELLWKKKFSDIMTPESSEIFRRNSSFFKETGWIRDAEYELICADGTVKTVLLSVSAVKDPDDKYIMSRAGLFDITERKRVEDALKKTRDEKEALRDSHDHYRVLATRDSLTGLYNRHYFNEIIHRELDRAKRYGENLSIIIVDIDNFKQLNDTYGHQHGDGVLKECAAILSRAIRGSDILCRFGGDEFMIVTPEMDCTENNAITSRIDKHISEWNRQFSTLGYELSLSIGCAMWKSGKDLIEVMKEADSSMYANKKSKKAQKE